MSTHIEEAVAENSDFMFQADLVGEDGETPVDPDVVQAISMIVRDVAGGVLTVPARDITADLDVDSHLATRLTAVDNRVVSGSGELQLRLITLLVTHSSGRKRNQEFTYYLDAMQDVPDTIVP